MSCAKSQLAIELYETSSLIDLICNSVAILWKTGLKICRCRAYISASSFLTANVPIVRSNLPSLLLHLPMRNVTNRATRPL